MHLVVHVQSAHSATQRAAPGSEAERVLSAVRRAEAQLGTEAMVWPETWREVLDRCFWDVDCLVVVAPRVSGETVHRLEDDTRSLPPVVVVAQEPLEAAHALRRAVVHEIVEAAPGEVRQAVRRAATSSAFERAARVAERHPRLSPLLRNWMARTLRAHPPYSRVAISLQATPVSRSTLRRHWRLHVGVLTPKRWLSHVQLARARSLFCNVVTWSDLAAELKISRRTLMRLPQRLMSVTLEDLEATGAWREDLDRVVAALLNGRLLE